MGTGKEKKEGNQSTYRHPIIKKEGKVHPFLSSVVAGERGSCPAHFPFPFSDAYKQGTGWLLLSFLSGGWERRKLSCIPPLSLYTCA